MKGGEIVRLFLKTMVSNHSEVPFLWMMFAEAAPYVDKIIVTEFNQTHSGLPREMIFQQYVDQFQKVFPQLVYLTGEDISGVIHEADTPDDHHHNETLMRGWFARQLKFRDSDVVFSTDADEVLYEATYKWVIDNFVRKTTGVRFRLHQFFYRPNYLWLGKEFIAPVALRYGRYKREFPTNWRYQGATLPGFWGVHFSWCIPIDEMVKKVKNYSHASEHKHLDQREIYLQARENGTFPFDDREFHIHKISFSNEILPPSFHTYSHLLDPDVLGDS